MNDALLLEASITRCMGEAFRDPEMWTNPGGMEEALESVRKLFASPALLSGERRVTLALAEFRKTGCIPNFSRLKYICLGAGEISNGWCVLSEPGLREELLLRSSEGSLRGRIKCFQALLQTYFSFARDDEDVPAAAREGWIVLRHWLFTRFASLREALSQTTGARTPEWFTFLSHNLNLLTSDPCRVYGIASAQSVAGVLQELKAGLAIPQRSWLWAEALLARVDQAVRLADAPFRESLDNILTVVFCSSEFTIAQRLSARCVARLISRYAQCTSRPDCMALRDAAIAAIGNPWLRRQAWDAYVLDDAGKPDEGARELVLGWLRRGLIKDFFELLSEDRAAEPRRLHYWLRFEPVIEDMWFILGSQALRSSQTEYVEFRKCAKGRVLALCGQTGPSNNAFVMRIGGSLAVEFGINNNACFLSNWNQLGKAVMGKLASGAEDLEVDIENLRGGIKLIHRDSPRAEESWEEKFDRTIIPRFGYKPFQKPLRVPPSSLPSSPSFPWHEVERHVETHSLLTEDNRRQGGAYWVLAGNGDPNVTKKLRTLGFRYRKEKGWWKE